VEEPANGPSGTPDAPDGPAGDATGAPDGPAGEAAGHTGEPASGEPAGETAPGDSAAPGDEVAEIVGKLTTHEEMNPAERRRLLGRLSKALGRAAERGASGVGRGRWLADIFLSIAPRVPIRDLRTLQEHHYGLTGEQLADDLIRTAAKATMTVGAVGGAVAAAEFAAPPLLLSAPAMLVAETLVVSAIEVKLIAELHEVYGVQVPGTLPQRTAAYTMAWSRQRGIDPLAPGTVTIALGAAAKTALRHRLMRTLGRHLTTLGPFLTGAIAGGALNRVATRRLATAVRADLRRQLGRLPGSQGSQGS
jgi:hypothetical protein